MRGWWVRYKFCICRVDGVQGRRARTAGLLGVSGDEGTSACCHPYLAAPGASAAASSPHSRAKLTVCNTLDRDPQSRPQGGLVCLCVSRVQQEEANETFTGPLSAAEKPRRGAATRRSGEIAARAIGARKLLQARSRK